MILLPGDLQLWRVELDRPPATTELLAECLSPEERGRAERFVRQTDRRQFIVSHAAVRSILGKCLDVAPERVEMTIRPGGKPELTPAAGAPPLRYSLSHSEGLAMVALTLGREVGIDVERVRPSLDVANIVERYFAPGERAAWRALPECQRLAAFFRCWTRKEAYLKARGVGLSSGLDRFEVSLAPDEPARLLRGSEPSDSGAQWCVYDVSPGGEYIAACVVEGEAESVSVADWTAPSGPM
jgi:4'-phosphopantetheinyl transferase